MKFWGAILVSGVFALSLGSAAQNLAPPTQPPAAVPTDDTTRILVDVTRVNMLFTVTDKKGRFITDLNKDDFEVIEGKKPQVIQEFTAETDLPLRIGILVDTSSSIRERFKFEQEAAVQFLNSVVHPGADKAMVVSFDTSAELVADLVDDTLKLDSAIRSLRPGGGTALYDAIFFACRDKLLQDQPRHKFRRAIVLVSDGEDNQSRYSRDQALEMAQKADVVIYAISTNITRIETDGDKVLRYLTQETGGRAFFPSQVTELNAIYTQIADELSSQYTVGYTSKNSRRDGAWRRIVVRVGRPSVNARTKQGYFAPSH
ncbi:MAG TPA: VWA domain-containing protein [Bryobacteraceae bacterium]